MNPQKRRTKTTNLPNLALILDTGQLALVVTAGEFRQARRAGRQGLHVVLLTPAEQKIAFKSLEAGGDDASVKLGLRVIGGGR